MTRFLSLSLLCIVLPLGLMAQQSSTRKVGSYEEVIASGNVRVYVQEGASFSLKIETQNLELDKVVTEVTKKELKIKLRSGVYNKDQVAVVYLSAPLYRSLKASSNAWIGTEGTLAADRIVATALSGGIIDLNVICQSIEGRASEGGDLFLTGNTGVLDASAVKGGHLYGYPMSAREVFAKANVGGVAEVKASDKLEANAVSGGKILYQFSGKAEGLSISSSLGGSVEAGTP